MLPAFSPLARRAWIGFAVAVVGGGATLLISYFRALRKIVEQPDILPGPHRVKWPQRLGSSLESAVLLFTARTLLRSRQHRVILSFYLGTGFAVVLAYVNLPFNWHGLSHAAVGAQAPVPFLIASTLMMCIAVAGMRILFPIPIALRANWIFRLTELRETPKYSQAVRRTLFMLGVMPVWVVSGVLLLLIFPFRFAVGHLLALGLLGTILVEACLQGFRKIPFTCSYLPGKGNVQYLSLGCLLVFLPLIDKGAEFEMRMLQSPFDFVSMILVLAIAATLARWRSSVVARPIVGMQFDEAMPPDIFALKLHSN
jgi:hypothetical protein